MMIYSGITLGQSASTLSAIDDDVEDTSEIRQGYQTSRIAPDQPAIRTPRNLDNMVTSIVSPGFHGFSMDDRAENCRIRMRTTGGHQVIMDDTNERIYISTSTGENSIEMDEQGNIDIYTSGKISAHAEQDINFTTDRSFRVYAKSGIHLKSDAEVRIQSEDDTSIISNGAMRALSSDNMYLQTGENMHLKVSGDTSIDSQGITNIKSKTLKFEGSSEVNIKSGGAVNVLAGGNANIQGSQVQLNGGTSAATAGEASEADPNNSFTAWFTNRIPDHEPWARADTENDTSINPQFDYTSSVIGKKRRVTTEDGTSSETIDITRGTNWRR